MPIYEYRCTACHHAFEKLVPMSGASQPPCPNCGSQETNLLISLFSTGGSRADAGTRFHAPSPPAAGGCCGGRCGCRH
ncbi:MAG: zinc ribbon domain-containing protein [Armatimonadetes bacterium]|nr:zinc ribbon domain-containing protein [Armatimonadota bacterium]